MGARTRPGSLNPRGNFALRPREDKPSPTCPNPPGDIWPAAYSDQSYLRKGLPHARLTVSRTEKAGNPAAQHSRKSEPSEVMANWARC